MLKIGSQRDIDLIEEIHRIDVAATLRGDIETLKSLMDAECVVFPPDHSPADGRDYLEKQRTAIITEQPASILDLRQDWQELQVSGDLAYEQGIVRYVVRTKDGTRNEESQLLVRILRRQADGGWLVYRAIWLPPQPVSSN
jgi:ketosteroid isomerase-like protein